MDALYFLPRMKDVFTFVTVPPNSNFLEGFTTADRRALAHFNALAIAVYQSSQEPDSPFTMLSEHYSPEKITALKEGIRQAGYNPENEVARAVTELSTMQYDSLMTLASYLAQN